MVMLPCFGGKRTKRAGGGCGLGGWRSLAQGPPCSIWANAAFAGVTAGRSFWRPPRGACSSDTVVEGPKGAILKGAS